MGNIIYFIPVVTGMFCLYFSYISRKLNENYKAENKELSQKLKDKGESDEKVNEALEKLKNRYSGYSNQQFLIFVLAISKCFVSYEDLIGIGILLYGLNKILENYTSYKIDSKYKLRDLLLKKEESQKVISLKRQLKTKFINTVVHCVFYTASQLQGYFYSKSRKFWAFSVASNTIDNKSTVISFLFAYKNVISFYALFFTLYVISYRIFVDRVYRVFDDNFRMTFSTLFSLKQNKMNLYIYLGVCAICLLRSAVYY